MGGTSADIAVMIDGEIELTTNAYIGDVPLMMPWSTCRALTRAADSSFPSMRKAGDRKPGALRALAMVSLV
jgi:hypothetical protein